jgi:DNA repair protein RecN (Recombination protein N)
VVGRKLQRLARQRQVLCVTHLPQIASRADAHFRIEKKVEAGRTRTRVRALEGDARVSEIARMLGGARVTRATREHAAEMIGQSR